jgi:hypothetical protein
MQHFLMILYGDMTQSAVYHELYTLISTQCWLVTVKICKAKGKIGPMLD